MTRNERFEQWLHFKLPAIAVAALVLMGVPHMLYTLKRDRLIEYYRTTDITNLFDLKEFKASDAVINEDPVAFARVVMHKALPFDMGAYQVTSLQYGNASGSLMVHTSQPIGMVLDKDNAIMGIDYNLVDWNLPLIQNLSRRDPCLFFWIQSYRILLPYDQHRDTSFQSNNFCIAEEVRIQTDLPPLTTDEGVNKTGTGGRVPRP